MAHLQLDIPEDIRAMISDAIVSGEFSSDGDVVTAAMRVWSAERAEREDLQAGSMAQVSLQHLLDEAGEDESDVDPAEVYTRLKAEFPGEAHSRCG